MTMIPWLLAATLTAQVLKAQEPTPPAEPQKAAEPDAAKASGSKTQKAPPDLLTRTPRKLEDQSPSSLNERVIERLNRAQKLMGSEKFDEALEALKSLEESVRGQEYALAQVRQLRGYIYAQQSKYKEAAKAFEECLALNALPLDPTLRTMFAYAQVLAGDERYVDAVKVMQDFLANKPDATGDNVFLYAQLLAQVDLKEEAAKQAERAQAMSGEVKESWLRLLTAIYFELKRYPDAAATLERLLVANPDNKQYWKQLSSVYLEAEQDDKALAALEAAYKKGLIVEEKELLQMARLALYREVPFKAGQYLKKALDEGKIAKNRKNVELLADAWIQSQELDRALDALSLAAPLAEDGMVYVRQGQLLLEKEKYKEAAETLNKGLNKGGLKKPGVAHLSLGIAQYRLGNFQQAIAQFQKAKTFPDNERSANEWINHLNQQTASQDPG
jgi:tetratricopeptide (TPR) repeat protein